MESSTKLALLATAWDFHRSIMLYVVDAIAYVFWTRNMPGT